MDALLDLTLREALSRLLSGQQQIAVDADPWVDPKSLGLHRDALQAAQRGELALSKIGRKYFVRRSELDRWIDARRVTAETHEPKTSAVEHILVTHGFRARGR